MDNSLYNRELQQGEYFPKAVFSCFREWNGYYMDVHKHNEVEIMYAISGRCTVEIGGKLIVMKNSDFILLDANVPHNLIVETGKPCRMLTVQFVFLKARGVFPSFREIAAESTLFRSFLELRKPYVLLKDSDEVYTSLKSMVIELSEIREENRLIINSLILQLLLQLSQLTLEAENRRLDAGDIYVKRAIQYMKHNYDCDIKTVDIAAEVNIHPVYLHRIFKERMSSTIVEYLTRLRLEKARMLLANTDIPIIEVSNYVGMNSRQYFSYMFKKYTGMTPASYRKSIDKSANDVLYRS